METPKRNLPPSTGSMPTGTTSRNLAEPALSISPPAPASRSRSPTISATTYSAWAGIMTNEPSRAT